MRRKTLVGRGTMSKTNSQAKIQDDYFQTNHFEVLDQSMLEGEKYVSDYFGFNDEITV